MCLALLQKRLESLFSFFLDFPVLGTLRKSVYGTRYILKLNVFSPILSSTSGSTQNPWAY